MRKMTFSVPEPLAVQFLRKVASRERSRFVSEALAARLEERDAALIRACEIANQDWMWPKSRENLTESATKCQNQEVIPNAVISVGSLDRRSVGDRKTRPCVVISVRCSMKSKDGDRCPVEFAEGQPADPDPDLL